MIYHPFYQWGNSATKDNPYKCKKDKVMERGLEVGLGLRSLKLCSEVLGSYTEETSRLRAEAVWGKVLSLWPHTAWAETRAVPTFQQRAPCSAS